MADIELSTLGATIKIAYEGEPDTNAFTDAEKAKLSGIEEGAQVNTVNSVAGKTGNVSLVKADVGLNLVDNVSILSWGGSSNIVAVGNVTSGKWQATAIADAYISSATAWNAKLDDVTGLVTAGTNVTITGAGTKASPYVVNASGGGGGAVDSVNGQTGVVVLDADDIDDSSTTHKFVTAGDLVILGNTSGVNTGDQTTVSGNAGTATKLQTARTINGVSFDGTANITVTAAAGTLSGDTLAAGVTKSSLTTLGTVIVGKWQGTAIGDSYISSAAAWNAKLDDITGLIKAGTNISITGSGTKASPYQISASGTGGGDVNGPASSTDNAISRFDGTDGKTLQNSNATVDDDGNLTIGLGLTNQQRIEGGSSSPIILPSGAGSNITQRISSKGTGGVGFYTNGGTILQAQVTHTNSAVNYLSLTGAASGGHPVLSAVGSGADINVVLTPKGAGIVSVTSGITASGSIAASNFSGSSSGTNTGDQTTITGNAGTATKLQTARTINGTSFDGSANITITAAAGTLTGDTLNSGVTKSSLTTLGTVTTGTWQGTAVADSYIASAASWNGRASKTQSDGAGGLWESPADGMRRLFINMPYAGTITSTATRSTAGTCTATFSINGTPLGGSANSVSTSESVQSHSSANTFVAGDDIEVTISSNASCANLSFMVGYTRTLA